MLKVNELMIGDWVKVDDNFSKWLESLYLRVQGLNDTLRPLIETEYQLKGREAWASIKYGPEHIEPIPLTEEILKANGFTTNVQGCECYGQFQKSMGGYMTLVLSLQDGEYKGSLTYKDVCNTSWKSRLWGINCFYVHELQHALRICGLNDLADNFKVNYR